MIKFKKNYQTFSLKIFDLRNEKKQVIKISITISINDFKSWKSAIDKGYINLVMIQ